MKRAVAATILVAVCGAPQVRAATPRPKMAVMEMEDRSKTLTPALQAKLTDYLRTRLVASGDFVVIDRGRQSKTLKRLIDEAKKESYKECYDKGCQIPLGKALSADSIVRLFVEELADTYVVSVEHIDLAKEASVGGGVAECAADPAKGREKRLMLSIRSVAEQLAGGTSAPPPARTGGTQPPPPPPAVGGGPQIETGRVTKALGDLTVSIKPYGKVRLDLVAPGGDKIASGSPYENRRAAPGRWRVLAQAAGHEPEERSFQVPPDEPTLIKSALAPLGGLVIEGKPAGAAVKVSGPHGFAHQGGLPWKAQGLRLGSYEVSVSRQGYVAFETRATVSSGETTELKVTLDRERAAAAGGGGSAAGKAGLVWVKIPGGSFQMGSNAGYADEKPVHRVTLDGFELTKSEVTVAQYEACVKAGKCSAANTGQYCNWGKNDRGDHPINCVDWDQSVAFCQWAGGRLPTEAQWEYAARSGGRDWKYPWGDEAATCDRAVMDDGGTRGSAGRETDGCGEDRTWPVCSKPRGHSKQGLCDLAGNVWEWVSDWKGSYSSGSSRNPTGPSSGSDRVYRGGCWYHPAANLRAASRDGPRPGTHYGDLGFRCLRSHP